MKEEKRFRKLYDSMLGSGELKDVFGSMTGDWEKDKKKFIKEQLDMEELLNMKDVDTDSDDYYDYDYDID